MKNELPISCGDGWLHLIKACHEELLAIDPGYKPTQIKEKFGSLRFYFESTLDRKDENFLRMYSIANRYELESMKTCEKCGKPGEGVLNGRWLHTLCEHHANFAH